MVEFLIKLLLVARSHLRSRARLEAEDIVLRQLAKSRVPISARVPLVRPCASPWLSNWLSKTSHKNVSDFRSRVGGRGGRIINTASIAGKRGSPMMAAYSAAKHGVIGLTRSLALELGAFKITVNAVCPGFVETQLLEG